MLRGSKHHEFHAVGVALEYGEGFYIETVAAGTASPPFSGFVFWRGIGVSIPTALALPVMIGLPIWFWLHGILRPKQVRQGYCAVCVYDLRATPDRCPECGKANIQ